MFAKLCARSCGLVRLGRATNSPQGPNKEWSVWAYTTPLPPAPSRDAGKRSRMRPSAPVHASHRQSNRARWHCMSRASPSRSDSYCCRVSIHAAVRAATRVVSSALIAFDSFNPRGRTGRDAKSRTGTREGPRVSIHAAVRAATSVDCSSMTSRFQSTRPYGPRLRFSGEDIYNRSFQSTRPYGPRQPI